jgi:hypothetical protein
MTVSTSLYELILRLLRDPEALEDFKDDPDAYLASCGDFSSDDVKDAIELIRDHDDGDSNNGRDTVHIAPPSDPPAPRDGESEHEAAVRYLNTYVTNNYVDDRDTIVDNSINQQIDTDGGDFDQDIDIDSTVASGDGAVAAGDDINAPVTTGDGNQVGEGNVSGDGNVVGAGNQVVTGDDNTTAFGGGDATSLDVDGDLTVGDGSAFATGGDAFVDNTDNSIEDSGNVSTETTFEDSGNVTVDESINDSGNESTGTSFENSGNDNSDNSIEIDNSQEDSNNDLTT